ncbi:hypothetical protein GIB67_041025 [Kingdonia uniflora]|uniref:Uncharacterized protein n=1 Tax=Kingdonia uniflora TaxID=39325 RepID=A0A7J7NCG5_9MAGN|nr:hypothetical protein GIB67_041025 [Kingdonia uniflora]
MGNTVDTTYREAVRMSSIADMDRQIHYSTDKADCNAAGEYVVSKGVDLMVLMELCSKQKLERYSFMAAGRASSKAWFITERKEANGCLHELGFSPRWRLLVFVLKTEENKLKTKGYDYGDQGIGISTDAMDREKGKYVLIKDPEEYHHLGLFDKPLPCFGCGIGWFSFLLGFVFPLMWYYATILYFGNYYQKDPRERAGLAASAIAALACSVAGLITALVLLV